MSTVTDKEIQDWKAEHGTIFSAEFESDEDEQGQTHKIVGFFKKPDRNTLNYISSLANQPFKMQEQMVVRCWLGGDAVILKDERYLMGAAQVINEVIEIKRGELKALEETPDVTGDAESVDLRGMGALLRYFFHLDPDALSDDEFFARWKELQWVLRLTKPFQANQ